MAAVNLQKSSIDKNDTRRGLAQLEMSHNNLIQQLTYILTNLDDRNLTATFLASLKEGGTTNGNSSPT